AATVLIVLLTSIGIAAPLVSRLRRLTTASQEVAGGNLGVRVRDKSNDAIGKLAQQFDKMTATLQRQHEEQASFLQGVTHELATPLARLEFALELLEQAPDDDSRANRTDALRRELGELGALADEILEWSCQSPDAVVEPEPIDLVDVVRDLIERTPTNGTHIALNAPESESVAGELRSVQRALDNVLRNALSYADSRVLVRVKATAEHVEVWFEDDGPGVPETHRTRIFDPFTRADSSRDRRTGGAGLGLSIVRRIVERHGGEASAHRSGTLGGAAILIRLPR
ncbi:MAG: ATP-binding protein, partial [Myxococcota bacterium]